MKARTVADQFRINVEPVIDKAFPFANFPAALTHLESGTHFGKVVIRV